MTVLSMSRKVMAGIFIFSIIVMAIGLAYFLKVFFKIKNQKAKKLVIALTGLCVVLTGFEVYLYITCAGYLRVMVCLPMIIYGGALIWLARWYKRPTITISSKYAVDSKRAKQDYILQKLDYAEASFAEGEIFSISLKPDRYNADKIPVIVTDRKEEEKTVNKNVNKRCVLAVEDILNKYKVNGWKKLAIDENADKDAKIITVSVEYQNHDMRTFSSNQQLSEDDKMIFGEIRDCIMEYSGLAGE